jgi:hypothetical protein
LEAAASASSMEEAWERFFRVEEETITKYDEEEKDESFGR